jgi:TrmH family RNA methyltransferase
MPIRIVQSKHNARLKELRRALANPGCGQAGVEGPKLIGEALNAGLRVECVFVAQGAENLLAELGVPSSTEILAVPRELLVSALTTETPQPIAALITAVDWTWSDVLEGDKKVAPLVVILAGIQDPGNLGTILRSGEAFGATGIVSLPGTVSAWNPKAVRASAGSVFRVPVIAADAEECFTRLRANDVKILTTTVRGNDEPDFTDFGGAVALLIGNEGNGVPGELSAWADGALTIPCPGPVESLNAAVAASVLLYEASRQRAARPVAHRSARSTR